MEIRKSTMQDLDAMLTIYEAARRYMADHGNPTQWGTGYPKKDMLAEDIHRGESYVILDGERIVGTFAFIIGPEPTYQIIEDGAWHHSAPYGTIHRLASDGSEKGIAKACFDYCAEQIDHLRVDTHRNNLTMQAVIEKSGFQRCGIIYQPDGTDRIAYDRHKR